MNLLLWNVLLAILWAAITADFTLYNLFVGMLLGFIILLLIKPLIGESKYFTRLGLLIGFALYFLRELLVSSLRVAYEIVTPGYQMRPGVIALPLDAKTNEEITILANLISLTPGTLSLDVSSDKKVLYVHAMYIDTDVETLRKEIKSGLERKLLEVLR